MSTESTELPREPQRGSPSYFTSGTTRAREARQRLPKRRAQVTSYMDEPRTAQALGWLSIGLGLTGLLAPRVVGQLTGMGPRTGLLRAVGMRELASGVGLLSARDATPWLWSRVLGDTMDLMALGAATVKPAVGTRTRALVSLGVVGAITAADVAASLRQTRNRSRGLRAGAAEDYLERSIVISKSPQECYDYWRKVTNAPNYMRMIENVTELDGNRSHWVATIAGKSVEWDSRISEEKPGERIAWHSEANAPVTHAGVVSFERAPGDRGTIVRLVVHYRPPAGGAGMRVSQWLGHKAPGMQLQEDLRRFKQILETGEIPTTRGQPHGGRSTIARMVGAGRGA